MQRPDKQTDHAVTSQEYDALAAAVRRVAASVKWARSAILGPQPTRGGAHLQAHTDRRHASAADRREARRTRSPGVNLGGHADRRYDKCRRSQERSPHPFPSFGRKQVRCSSSLRYNTPTSDVSPSNRAVVNTSMERTPRTCEKIPEAHRTRLDNADRVEARTARKSGISVCRSHGLRAV